MKRVLSLTLLAIVWAMDGCRSKAVTSEYAKPTATVSPGEGVIVLPPDSPKLAQLRVEPVQTAKVPVDEITAPCKVDANPNRISRVALPVAGRIVRVNVKLGDSVASGQSLLEIESPDADAAIAGYTQSVHALNQANANLAQFKSALVKAQVDYDRSADLFEHQAIAEKDLLNVRTALDQAKAAVQVAHDGVESARAVCEQARQRLTLLGLKETRANQRIIVRSPLSGKVLELSAVAGEYRNDTSAAVMTISDLRTVWVTSDVPENSIRFIKIGEPVEIALDAYPGENFRGRVARVADTLDPKTRTVKAMIELDNPGGRLRPEMFGRITLSSATTEAPVVPSGAVVQDGERHLVCVQLDPGRFRWREVITGNRSGNVIAITEGLSAGERIVTDGVFLLKQ